MKPADHSKLPDDIDDKMRFFFEQAEKVLASTVVSYDVVASKAFTLFSVIVTLVSALFAYTLFHFDTRALLSWAALVYVGFLVASGVYCWLVVRVRDVVCPGRKSDTF